jgi:hypothetical protein
MGDGLSKAGSGQIVYSNQYNIDNVVMHTGMAHGRNLLIDYLRQAFSRDKEFIWRTDIFGFAKTPSHLGLSPDTGLLPDDSSTRIFIGSQFRSDMTFLPAITVRTSSMSYHPISFNQNAGLVLYEWQKVIDGYGVETILKLPSAVQFVGAWDSSYEIKVSSKSLEDTVAVADLVMFLLQHRYRLDMQRNGFFIKKMSAGAETAENINNNDPLYHISISLDAYSEWAREIPISNLIERVRFCFEVDAVDTDIPATGLAIEYSIEL